MDPPRTVFSLSSATDHPCARGQGRGFVFEIHGLFAEVLGKDTGLSRGMGGSMHLWDQARGFYGSVPIVAGNVVTKDGRAGVQTGEMVRVTPTGVERMHSLPRGFGRIG